MLQFAPMTFRPLLIVLAATIFGTPSAEAGLRPLRTIEALSEAAQDSKNADRPFAVTGTVQYCCLANRRHSTIDILSPGGTQMRLYELLPRANDNIRLGDTIAVSGIVTTNDVGNWSANYTNVQVLARHGPYRRISGRQFFDNGNRHKIVSLRGIVRGSFHDETSPDWVYLVLYSEGRCINTTLFTDGKDVDLSALLGRKVEIVGWIANASSTPCKCSGRVLIITDPSYISVLDTPKDDASNIPSLDAISIETPPEELISPGLHRVSGVVHAIWGNKNILIRTTGGSFVNLSVNASKMPPWGSRIVAVGLPATNFYQLQLEQAQWRIDERPPVDNLTNRTARIRRIPEGTYEHGQPLRLEGTVRYVSNDIFHDQSLLMESGGRIVPVDVCSIPDVLERISVGCRIAVSGICIVERSSISPTQPVPTVQGFRIAVRRAEDIRILSRPSWWTPVRTWSVFGGLFTAFLAVVLWNVALRKAAARRGRELAEEQISRAEADLRTDERTRLAIELHDTLSQNLMGVAMRLDAVTRAVSPCTEAVSKRLALLAHSINYCRGELRQCLWDLRSRALEEQDMNEVIRQTVSPHVSADVALAIRFNVPRNLLTDQSAHALIRIVRELTLNAIHHGKASQIKIAGSFEAGNLLFSVTDNGTGFDVSTVPGIREGHFGLQGVRERVNLFGGTTTIESRPGKGTKVTIHIKATQIPS